MVDFVIANKIFDFLLNRQLEVADKLWNIRKLRPTDWHVTVAWAVGEEKVHEVDRLVCATHNRY